MLGPMSQLEPDCRRQARSVHLRHRYPRTDRAVFLLSTLVFCAIGVSLLSILSVLARLPRLRQLKSRGDVPATLILPLTGPAPELDTLIQALNAQTLQPQRLLICVESEADPAFARAGAAAALARFPVECVVAGPASDQSQKCRNQQAALDYLGLDTLAADAVIVFIDGDIVPGPAWLGTLVSPIAAGTADLVSAHRWQQVTRPRLGAHLVAAVDRAVTLMPRLDMGFARVVWGGSIAIGAPMARRMDLRAAFDRTLSDDLSLALRASRQNLRIMTRGSLMLPSPNGQALAPAWRFARRQYQMCRLYRPWLWALALATPGLRLAGWAAALWLAFLGAGLVPIAALAALGLIKQFVVGKAARRLNLPDPPAVRAAQLALGLCQPVADLFHASAVLAAARTRTVRWGHVDYEVRRTDDIRILKRRPFSS